MLLFLLGMIAGALILIVIACISVNNKKDVQNDYQLGYKDGHDDGYQEGLHDARWKGESDDERRSNSNYKW